MPDPLLTDSSADTLIMNNGSPRSAAETTPSKQHKAYAEPGDISDMDDALCHIGYGTYQRRLMMLCGAGFLNDGMWLSALSLILPQVNAHFNVSLAQSGILPSCFFGGMFAGAIVWGLLSDKNGRKSVFDITLLASTLLPLMLAFSPTFGFMSFLACLLGFFVSGQIVVNSVLFMEFLPKTHYSLLALLSVFFAGGGLLATLAAWAVIHDKPTAESGFWADYRTFILVISLVGLGMMMYRIFGIKIMESPKFLITTHRVPEAMDVLFHIHSTNNGLQPFLVTETAIDPNFSLTPTNTADSQSSHSLSSSSSLSSNSGGIIKPLVALLQHPYHLITPLLWFIWFAINFSYTSFNIFLPVLLQSRHVPISDSHRDLVLYTAVGVVSSYLAHSLTKFKTKPVMIILTLSCAASFFLFTSVNSQFLIVLAMSLTNALACMIYALLYAFTPTMYRTSLRGNGNGMAAGFGRLAGILAPIIGGLLLEISPAVPVYSSLITMAAASIAIIVLPFRTYVS